MADNVFDLAWYLSTRTGHTGNDEFNTNTSANYTTVLPSGAATWNLSGAADVASVVANGQTSGHAAVALSTIAISQGGYIEAAMRCVELATVGQNKYVGICLADGTAAGSNFVGIVYRSNDDLIGIAGGTLNNWDFLLTAPSSTTLRWRSPLIHARLLWVGANTWGAQLSPDGVSWSTFTLANQTKTMTPTVMGLLASTYGVAGDVICSWEYLRCSG